LATFPDIGGDMSPSPFVPLVCITSDTLFILNLVCSSSSLSFSSHAWN